MVCANRIRTAPGRDAQITLHSTRSAAVDIQRARGNASAAVRRERTKQCRRTTRVKSTQRERILTVQQRFAPPTTCLSSDRDTQRLRGAHLGGSLASVAVTVKFEAPTGPCGIPSARRCGVQVQPCRQVTARHRKASGASPVGLYRGRGEHIAPPREATRRNHRASGKSIVT